MFQTPNLPCNSARPAATDAQPLEIRVEDLHKSFGPHPILQGIELQIHRGEIVAIVGRSGSGKTVLLDHIIGRLKPDRGRVLLADHESPDSPLVDLNTLDEAGLDRLRMHWAVVFQRNALYSATVYENIALSLREVKGMEEQEIRRRATVAVASVGLDPKTVLDKHRDDLSGGMAKRVAVARALANDPMLIFYDEPTTGQDPEHAQQIHNLICDAHARGCEDGSPRTTLIISHDKDLLARLRPRIVMLHEGIVFFDGPYESFAQSDSPVIRPYFALMPALHERERSKV
jgi:phospholipid/cholesterol/gamma-HCH transport system ATP-binding protein